MELIHCFYSIFPFNYDNNVIIYYFTEFPFMYKENKDNLI